MRMGGSEQIVLRAFRLGLSDDSFQFTSREPPRQALHDHIANGDTYVVNNNPHRQLAVEVLGLHHSYDGIEPVLRGLNMAVPFGSIFGLLGASGCGKTTLLKCVLGMMRADSGFIDVFGKQPGAPGSLIPGAIVGYMPQDVALYQDLTIREILIYFGRLYFMSASKIKQQIAYLMQLLELPSKHRMVNTLSGGQMRRVSFAAALIHEPPLVVLDEPTAGVDPMLR